MPYTFTRTGVLPTEPEAPEITSPRLGETTCACTNTRPLIISAPEVVTCIVTLLLAVDAVRVLCVKAVSVKMVPPTYRWVAWPALSVTVELPITRFPGPFNDQFTVTPGMGWPWAFFATTINGLGSWKF